LQFWNLLDESSKFCVVCRIFQLSAQIFKKSLCHMLYLYCLEILIEDRPYIGLF
jgi:hypothetical protein